MTNTPYVRQQTAVAPTAPRRQTPATVVLGAALLSMGLMAGLFFAFTVSVMSGLGASDDRTYVTAMQHINEKIENGLFGLVFTGALLFPLIAGFLLWRRGQRAATLWTIASVFCYLLVLGLTMGIEIPLNNTLAAAGPADRIVDLAIVRHDFESVWVPVNDARTALCTLAVIFLIPALYLHGRGSRFTPQRPRP